jgi:hypothetical protein
MRKHESFITNATLALLVLCNLATTTVGAVIAPEAVASGVGINVPVVGRVVGGGNTLFYTSIDVTNQMKNAAQVDYYFDAADSRTGAPIVLRGSITQSGLAAQGSGTMRAQSNVHFDDFVDALTQAGLITQTTRDDGVLGSLLVVFNGATKSGQGSVTARFANGFGGGTVGVSLRGHEMTSNEPQALVAAVRDTRGNTTGAAQLYPNIFINNTGLAPNGVDTSGTAIVQLSAASNSTGQAVGTPITLTILSGQTASVNQVLNALQVPPGVDDTILVYATVTSGNAAIQGLVSQVDATTRDGSAFEMSRADF